MMRTPLRGIYLITPDLQDTQQLLAVTADALQGGVALLQYRNKSACGERRSEQAGALLELCRSSRVPLVINDDLDLAVSLGADGVHLGGDDRSVSAARQAFGEAALIGASCYASLDRARQAQGNGASYIAFGTFATSPTKPLAARADTALLTRARALTLPVVAIGGITPSIAPSLVAAGADLLAVISAVYASSKPADAVRALRNAFPEHRGDTLEHQSRAV